MADLHTNYGLYLVVWFDLESWTEEDSRRARAARTTAAQLRAELDARVDEQAKHGRHVATVILDASLRRPSRVQT